MNIATTKGQTKTLSLPNILTYARIAAIPVVVGCVFAQSILDGPLWLRWVALAVFHRRGGDRLPRWLLCTNVGPAIRFWPDARPDRRQAAGSVLPPDAGRRQLASIGWTLWAAIVILCREILVSGLREYLAALRVSVPVTKLAKWKTTIQLVAIGFLIAGEAGEQILPATTLIGIALLWMSAIFTIYTGWDYFRAGIHHLIKEDEG